VDRDKRLRTIARAYASDPEGTLVVSPDNDSRRETNQAIHRLRQTEGQVDQGEHRVRVLVPRQTAVCTLCTKRGRADSASIGI
jgi:tRNA(Met) C34 N-acetyltransferase TmcA